MLKYTDTEVTFAEVPDEITLCINISNCPCHCPGCHSAYLAEDIGTELTPDALYELIEKNKGISCVGIMGGDADPKTVNNIAWYIKSIYEDMKVAWYSGRQELNLNINLSNFDYIKLGPYVKELGPLNNPKTNQKFYRVSDGKLIDITNKFWRNNHEN